MCPNRVLKSEEKQNYECSQDTALWSSVRGKADEVVPEVTGTQDLTWALQGI